MTASETTPRTFPVTIDAEDGTPRARITDLRDVRPARGYGGHGDAAAIAAALSKVDKLSAAQVRGVEHALEYAIRHAGYHASAPEKCAVDFDKVELYSFCGGRAVMLAFSGLAHVDSRDRSGRFLVAYSHCLTVGRRGGFKATGRGGVRFEGEAAVRELDYFGKGAK